MKKELLDYLLKNGGLKEGETYFDLGVRFGVVESSKDPAFREQWGERIRHWWRKARVKGVDQPVSEGNKKTFEIQGDSAMFEGTTTDIVTNIDQAIRFSGVDLDIWEPKSQKYSTWTVTMKEKRPFSKKTGFEVTQWNDDKEIYFKQTDISRTNYGCKIHFVKRNDSFDKIIANVQKLIEDTSVVYDISTLGGSGIGIAACADLHIGAKVSNLIRTPDFNIDVIVSKVRLVADHINESNFGEVHIILNGDYIESFQGLNHPSTFKSLEEGMWGANAVITVNKLLCEHLFSRVKNLKQILLVSGNHDRTSIDSKVDNTGEVGALLSYMLKLSLPEVNIVYNPLLISQDIDGINYIITHGNSLLSKQDLTTSVLNWGKQDMYNLMLEGHLHTRISKKVLKQSKWTLHNVDVVSFDEQKYRKIVLPSLFTGNYWSESVGFGGQSGFITVTNMGGYPKVTDFTF